MKIEPMAKGHIAGIAALERACFHAPWSENALREELGNESNLFFTAVQDGEVVGYLGCQTVLDEGYITNVAVAPGHRRQGIASALLVALQRGAAEKNLSFLTLEVRVSNEAAIALYEGFGYVPVGKRKNFYTDPTEDALLMTCYFNEQTE